MVIDMDESRLRTIEQLKKFLDATPLVAFAASGTGPTPTASGTTTSAGYSSGLTIRNATSTTVAGPCITVLMRVDPVQLDRALDAWGALWAHRDRSLAIDGKTLRGATDSEGLQVHVMSAVGHESKAAYTQKKSAA